MGVFLCVPCARAQEADEGVSERTEAPPDTARIDAALLGPQPAAPDFPMPAPVAEPAEVPLNLRNASIENVIDFIRKHTGKSVIRSADVRAQITIATPGPVPPDTAVKLIFEALRLEGVQVIERDDLVELVPFEKLAKLGVETRSIEVRYADVEQVRQLITPLLPDELKVVADSRSGQLILTGPAEKLADLERVVHEIDVPEVEGTLLRIVKLDYADATEVARVLESALGEKATGARPTPPGQRQPPKGPSAPAPSAQFTVVAYPTANWIVMRGPKASLEAAEALVKELDVRVEPALVVNVIPLKYAEATTLASQLAGMFKRTQRTKGAVSETIEVAADERANALIVYSTRENFELVRRVVAAVDTEEARRTQTRSYRLSYADAEDVAQQLNDLYSGMQQGAGFPWFFRRRTPQTTTRFVPERRTNSVIVIAQPEEFDQIEDLIEKLDMPISKTEISPRIYNIRNIGAKEVTDVLNQIFGIQTQAQRGGYYFYLYRGAAQQEEVGRLYGKVRFVEEPATNSVIVITNNKENFPIIEDLIKALDRPAPEYANTFVYPLENADAAAVADQLNTLFARVGAGGQQQAAMPAYVSWLSGGGRQAQEESPISNLIGKVRVVPDTRTNSLLITTAVQHIDVLRQLIQQLDTESPKVLIKVYLLEVTRSREGRIGTRFGSDSSIFESEDFNNGVFSQLGIDWKHATAHTTLSADIDVSLLIQFLQREFGATILSQPSLVVNNNKEATIFVGSQIPRLTESQREPGTTARNDSYEYVDVGTTLKIKPHINKNKLVVTSVSLESSQMRAGETLFGGAIFDSRKYDTEVAVEDGQTLVIGGILRQQESEVIHRVPILGHIPILKLLFSKKDTDRETTELIAFITPSVLTTRAEADAATKHARQESQAIDDMLPPDLQKSELPVPGAQTAGSH